MDSKNAYKLAKMMDQSLLDFDFLLLNNVKPVKNK